MSHIERALDPAAHTQAPSDGRPDAGPAGTAHPGDVRADPRLSGLRPATAPTENPARVGNVASDFRVAPEHLRLAGTAQGAILDEFRPGARTAASATGAAAAGLPGWQTAGRLTGLVSTWERQVAALERKLGESAAGLRLTADEFARTETRVTGTMGG